MTYLRARRSIKVAPGFKINLNTRSVGVTVGTRGAHYTVNSSGRRTATVGLPGTGLTIVDTRGPGRGGRTTHVGRVPERPTPAAAAPAPARHHAGLFTAHGERAYAKALRELRDGRTVEALIELDGARPPDRTSAAQLVAAIARFNAGAYERAAAELEPLVADHLPPQEVELLERYELPPGYAEFDVRIGQLDASAGVWGQGPVYLLAATYDALGRVREAAGVMQKLIAGLDEQPASFPLIILCELYQSLGDWDEIVHLVAHYGITNVDDGTLVLRTYQGIAMANEGHVDAALEVLKDCLRSTKRTPGLLTTARYNRGAILQSAGRDAAARRDFSRVYANAPDYLDVAERLSELEQPQASASPRPRR